MVNSGGEKSEGTRATESGRWCTVNSICGKQPSASSFTSLCVLLSFAFHPPTTPHRRPPEGMRVAPRCPSRT